MQCGMFDRHRWVEQCTWSCKARIQGQFCGIRHKELLPPIDVRVDSVLNCGVVESAKVSTDKAIESQLR